jgi:Flp pilus assembly protein TadG
MTIIAHILPRRSDRARKGAAATELAICLPMIVILVLGTLETTELIYLRQRLVTAAFEAARTASAPAKTSAAGITAGTGVLTARGISGGGVTISPTVTAATASGTEIAVTVTAPFTPNSCVTPFVLAGTVTDVTVTVKMVRQ